MSRLVMLQLTEADQQFLLKLARDAVKAYLSGETPRTPETPSATLKESYGAFVSLHQGEELRGCIGNMHPAGPLYRSAAECAIAAAVGDPRFMPLMKSELDAVEFEISVLSPIERVQDIQEIEIGAHGLLIRKRNAHGLLLPQVASTYGWDRERFLQETCKKAGLKPDDWKEGAEIHYFGASVFDEKQFQLI